MDPIVSALRRVAHAPPHEQPLRLARLCRVREGEAGPIVPYDYVWANCSAKMSGMENVTVNSKEQQRGLVIAEVDRGALSVGEGAA